jgi:hypothetical protein
MIRCWSIQTRCLVACNRFRTKHKVKVKLKFINCSFMFENRFWGKFSSDNFIFWSNKTIAFTLEIS